VTHDWTAAALARDLSQAEGKRPMMSSIEYADMTDEEKTVLRED
jgi:hypothetical protein